MKPLGQALKRERELRGVALDEIAKTALVQPRILAALENEDWTDIPGKFYFQQYMKSYLQAIGADVNAFFNTYKEYMDTLPLRQDEEPARCFGALKYSQFKRRNAALLTLLALAGGVALLVFLGAPNLNGFFDAFSGSAGLNPRLRIEPLPSLAKWPAERSWADVEPVRVGLTFSAPCWIQAAQDRSPVKEQIFQPGDKLELRGYRVFLMLGNPAAVRLQVNECPVTFLTGMSRPAALTITPFDVDTLRRR